LDEFLRHGDFAKKNSVRIFVHDYAGHPFQVQLSRELARRGHAVVHSFAGSLVTPRGALQRRDDDPLTFEIREISMNRNYGRNKYRFMRRRSMEVEYGSLLGHAIRDLRPELVISGNTPTEPQSKAARLCAREGVLFVSWIQDFYGLAVDGLLRKKLPLAGALIGRWYRWLEARTLRLSDGVIAITPDFEPLLVDLGVSPERLAVIPNWAPLGEISVGVKQNSWSRRFHLEKHFCFLYSGTLAMKHNPELLRALAAHFQKDERAKVVVISEGPGADWLRARKEEQHLGNLLIMPFEDFSAMSQVLATGDVLVAILDSEAGVFSVPSKVLTYLCAGKALLAAIPRENLAARIIQRSGAGLCVDSGQKEQFIASAERLYSEKELRLACGRRARQHADKNFEIGRITDRFEQFFTTIQDDAHHIGDRCQ
jgi:glycosyltransferase involved in cell wall biosynthesis